MPTPKSILATTSQANYFSNARPIWVRQLTRAYNCHLVFRKRFNCEGQIFGGELRIGASDAYRLFINGQLVGDGPARSEREYCYVDHYPAASLPIYEGENVIVVVALNKNLAEHGQPPKDGAFILSLDGSLTNGKTVMLRTGPDWKVCVADWYQTPAPRRFFPVGFNECVDFRNAPHDVIQAEYADQLWPMADVVDGRHIAKCTARPIPPFKYNHIFPKRLLRAGRINPLAGIMGVALNQCEHIPADSVRFRTYVYAEQETDAFVSYGCDSYSTVRVNGHELWTQGEPDHGFRKHLSEYENQWYAGMIHGHGLRFEPNAGNEQATRCQLKAGWNEVEVQVQFLHFGYGFELAFCHPTRRLPLPLTNSACQQRGDVNTWQWRAEDQTDWRDVACPHDQRPWLEPTHLAHWDQRKLTHEAPGVENLYRTAIEQSPFILEPGQFVELELETYSVGYLKIAARGPAGAVLDFALAERNDEPSDRLPYLNNGLWLAERMILSGGDDAYTGMERRAGRYVYLCLRQSEAPVEISAVLVRNQRYANERNGQFSSSDPVLNWMWEAGMLTTELSTFDLSEDCPTREMAQWSGDSYLRTNLLACLWGDLRLSEKAIREFALDQVANRWGRAMVPAGYGDSIVDYALLLPIWTWAHYEITSNQAMIAQVFPGVQNLFTHAATLEDERGYLIPQDRKSNQVYLDMRLVGAVRQLPLVTGLQAYYVKALEAGARLADLIQERVLAAKWMDKAERLRAQINQDFWAADRGLYVNGEDAAGQLAAEADAGTNYILMWANIPTPEKEEAILQQLFPTPTEENLAHWLHGEGAYMKYFMAEALLQRGHAMEALTDWRGYYGSMMGQVQTVPEAWDRSWGKELPTGQGGTPSASNKNKAAQGPGSGALRSLVHPFSIGPIWHFMAYICGLQPAEPGYRTIRWAPMPGDLEWIDASFPLPNQEEYMEIKMETAPSGGREFTLKRPKNIPVTLDRRWLNSNDRLIVL